MVQINTGYLLLKSASLNPV